MIAPHKCQDCRTPIWQNQRKRCTACTLERWHVAKNKELNRDRNSPRVLHDGPAGVGPAPPRRPRFESSRAVAAVAQDVFSPAALALFLGGLS